MKDIIAADEVVARHGTDHALLAQVLGVYKPDCRYLKEADTVLAGDALAVRARFAIPEPCYIEDTGHFNAVEFIICFNQMMYYAVAEAVNEAMLPPFSGWHLDDFWKRQLADFLIAGLHSRFRRPVSARRFYGEGKFVKLVQRSTGDRPLLLMDTVCRFWDDDGGRCEGEIKAALVGPPPAIPGADAA